MEFDNISCATCGVHFGIPSDRVVVLRKNHTDFYCPNGHSLSFIGESPSDKELKTLRAEVKELRDKLQAAQAEVELHTKKVSELTMELEIWRPSSEDSSTTPIERGKGTIAGLLPG